MKSLPKVEMLEDIDDYIKTVVNVDQEGAKVLATKCAPTLRNSAFVQILKEGLHGVAVLRIPEDHHVVVHSACGDHLLDLKAHVHSMVANLVKQAKAINAIPIGFADVIDWSGEESLIEGIGEALVQAANQFNLPILNGENAVLGERVTCGANVSGTMVSMISKKEKLPLECIPGIFEKDHVRYAVFDAEGKAVFINSDGVGTKTEFYERAKKYVLAVGDSFAMKVDDASKLGAIPKVVADVIEFKGEIPLDEIVAYGQRKAKEFNCLYAVHEVRVENRIKGYKEEIPSYNLSGSVVSIIDEARLKNPPLPQAGDSLVAIRGKPNPRSNGITSKRKGMLLLGESWCKLHGMNEWHETSEGQHFLAYLAEPSTVFYPVFNELLEKGLASAVFHMSGGAYESKLARPLARQGLFVKLEFLFAPDLREIALMNVLGKRMRDAYAQWPMGTEGFITTKDAEKAIKVLQSYGLEAKKVGVVEKAVDRKGIVFQAFNGEEVYFSGN
ncbi:MAG TPA: AIR synthase related protein [Candidatus Nanoarchaeia archaeon]|nr:AIR synthase related protein [Candidatus Nanoarchaeia archaeon]